MERCKRPTTRVVSKVYLEALHDSDRKGHQIASMKDEVARLRRRVIELEATLVKCNAPITHGNGNDNCP